VPTWQFRKNLTWCGFSRYQK